MRTSSHPVAEASPALLYLHPLCAVRSVLNDKDEAARLADLVVASGAALEPCLGLVPAFVVGAP